MHNKIHNQCIYILIIKIINFLKNIIFFLSLYDIKMTPKFITLTRKEYDLIAKNRGIPEPQKMSTEELLNTLNRYDSRLEVKSTRRKLLRIKLEKIANKQNISRNELHKAEKLQDKSIDDLQEIAKLRGIKNYSNLTKEDLIFSFL